MSEGTLGHVGLAAAYSYMQECQQVKIVPLERIGIERAMIAMTKALTKGSVPYRGVEQPLAVKADDKETITRMGDVVQHYLKTHFDADNAKYEVLSVEKEYEASFVFQDSAEMWVSAVVTGAMDTVFRNKTFDNMRVASIHDHKFVGDVGNALDFLPLDTQMLFYEAIMCEILIFLGDFDDVELIYDLHRRDVPPGFGHRPLKRNKDGSVAKNNASRDPDDYVKRSAPIRHSTKERGAIVRNIVIPLLSDVWDYRQGRNRSFQRRLIKTGGEACSNCYAQARCTHDILGRHMPDFSAFVEAQTKT
jgi:hypothetical protein